MCYILRVFDIEKRITPIGRVKLKLEELQINLQIDNTKF